MARPRKIPATPENIEPPKQPENYDCFADVLRRVDDGEIETAAKHLLRKAHDGDDWAISLLADLLRENNGMC